uniref:Uncharacterized protein n=1 Tax=Pseudomonas viridiflava TaxID=33069 RepID=I6LCY0_PSEVI|nr:hypothetical protein [Pseudomonas viridiflava]
MTLRQTGIPGQISAEQQSRSRAVHKLTTQLHPTPIKGFKKLPTDIPTISVDNLWQISNLKTVQERKPKILHLSTANPAPNMHGRAPADR